MDASTRPRDVGLLQLIYISSASSWPTPADLASLLEQSRARNLRQHVTGMLIYSNATYMQVLEGAPADVHEIFEAICKDPRNNGVVKLAESAVAARDFPNWTMGFQHLDDTSAVQPRGFVDVFDGKLDKLLALGNRSASIRMLMSFARGPQALAG